MIARRSIGVIVLVLVVLGCGASSRQAAIRDTYEAGQIASSAFEAFDKQHQLAIVALAPTEAEGRSELDAYRARRAGVLAALEAFWLAVGAAITVNDDASFSGMIKAWSAVGAQISVLKGAP